jgi:lipopolysaccharide transport system permease protein
MGKATVASPPALAALAVEPGIQLLAASSPAEWKAAVLRLLDDAALRQCLGSAARRYVEEHHAWKRNLEPLARLLEMIVQKPTSESRRLSVVSCQRSEIRGKNDGDALSPLTTDDRQPTTQDELPLTVIERQPGWRVVDFRELWRFRELFLVLTWRDIQVRYKQTALGIAWAVLQPLSMTIVLSVFFFRLAEINSGAVTYPLFAYAGLLPWTFFASAVSHTGQSVISNHDLVTKVYFPRLLLPLSAALAALVDFLWALLVLLILMFINGRAPTAASFFLYVPLLTAALAVTAVAVGTWFAALTVAYRDVRYALPFVLQLWMFATPAIYMREHTDLNPRWGIVLPFNPVDGLITNFRAAALGTEEYNLYALAVSTSLSVLLLILGSLYFRRVERSFADVI